MTRDEAVECGREVLALWPNADPEQVRTFLGNVLHCDRQRVLTAIKASHPASNGFPPWPTIYGKLPPKPVDLPPPTQSIADIIAERARKAEREQRAIAAWKPLSQEQRLALVDTAGAMWPTWTLEQVRAYVQTHDYPPTQVWGQLLGEESCKH